MVAGLGSEIRERRGKEVQMDLVVRMLKEPVSFCVCTGGRGGDGRPFCHLLGWVARTSNIAHDNWSRVIRG